MKFTFDYYHNLEQVELYLCNPDGRELFPIIGRNRSLKLRFNDMSELTFDVDSRATLSDGTPVKIDAYDYIQTKRLIYATKIGWFQIVSVDEHDDGVSKYKKVSTESLQSVLKNKGFISEERVYCFYNPDDPHDDLYDSTKDDAIPSVLGQWSKQLGIYQALGQGLAEPDEPYDNWTVTYVTPSLIYNGTGTGGACRTFKEATTYGYDWIVNEVENAFGVVVIFDFMYKTIHVMSPSEVTEKTNIVYSFDNFMKSISVDEKSEDIVTVLNCNGNKCNITGVNPTGTNYICDFSYYMDKVNYRWMSDELISKLEEWEASCASKKSEYEGHIEVLHGLYKTITEKETSLREMSLFLSDLKAAQSKRSVVDKYKTPGSLCGIVTAESVTSYRKNIDGVVTVVGGTSIKEGTAYYDTPFDGSIVITAYAEKPDYNPDSRKWIFSGKSVIGTADSIVAANLADDNYSGESFWYFSDSADGSSYCKLKTSTTIDKDNKKSMYYCGGFDRYIAYTYPTQSGSSTVYTDTLQSWINLREGIVNELNIALYGYTRKIDGYQLDSTGEVINPTEDSLYGEVKAVNDLIYAITSELNILSYFAKTPSLLRELNCYWIEGDYTNDNISVFDETAPEDEIELSNELLKTGRIELSKMCQPRFSFSVESANIIRNYEFRKQTQELELGKIITIEKDEGVWYYPVLLEMSMNLDSSEDFDMTFANAMRLDDWGYTYADLISDASSTSRKVSANWQDILAYSKDRAEISSIIKDPLNTALRAAFANGVNQDFVIDNNGILGRKRSSESSDEFDDEQMRIVNNLIIFTDDNWDTAKTALGKIQYEEIQPDGNTAIVSSYGLIAETIIGSLVMSERLKIRNTDSTVDIGATGITIKDKDGAIVFSAKPDGTISIKSFNVDAVNELSIRVNNAESLIKQEVGKISAKVDSSGGDSNSFAWELTSDGFTLYSGGSAVMSVDKDGGTVTNMSINSASIQYGNIGDLTINGKLYFGGNPDYYINANYKDRDFYLKLPGISIDETSGAVFSGELYAAKGTFEGELSAATGTFVGGIDTQVGVNITNASNDSLKTYMYGDIIKIDAMLEGSQTCSIRIGAVDVYAEGQKRPGFLVKSPNATTTWFNEIFTLGMYGAEFTDTERIGDHIGGFAMYINHNRYTEVYGLGSLYLPSSYSTTSDINLKKDIEVLSKNYEVLFNSLSPVRFRYKDGNSGRYHTGFIAQDVQSAVGSSGLSSSDFAAVCVSNSDAFGERWYLRYEEFISLNTWQIQKLKARVLELEKIIADMQSPKE